MAAQRFILISVQKGPLESGGSYASMWLQPLEWEDRAAPHLTRGPVPFKIDASIEAVDKFATLQLPMLADLDVGIRVASGNKSKGYVFGGDPAPVSSDFSADASASADALASADAPVSADSSADAPASADADSKSKSNLFERKNK